MANRDDNNGKTIGGDPHLLKLAALLLALVWLLSATVLVTMTIYAANVSGETWSRFATVIETFKASLQLSTGAIAGLLGSRALK